MMASPKSTNHLQVWHFKLEEGMQLQVNVFGSSNGRNGRVELQLKNCSRTWILHWGGLHHGQKNWVIPADHPCGTRTYKQTALQTPFMMSGDIYLIVIELRDPKIHAIEFVLKDGSRDRWLKLNQGNFRIEIPENETVTSHLSVPKDLVDHKAYLIWESKGKPRNSSQQQKIVKGLGETLVGAYPGRAMSFITKKSDLKSPIVAGYPSKNVGLFIKKQSLIFGSDFNGEDLEGYAGAGLYDSVTMDKEEEIVLDYSCDQLIVDKSFQRSLFSKIAEVGIIIENLYRSAQDIEGVVKHGEIFVVQTRPQI